MTMELRQIAIGCGGIELRAAVTGGDAKTIVGYAAKFNVRSQPLGGFVEQIAPGAFDNCLDDDVVALFNHDPNQVLARGAGLALTIDEIGLRYEFVAASDDVSQRVASYIADGRVSQSSFGFTTDEDDWAQDDDGAIVRTIRSVKRLYDISPVTYPAYLDTAVALRSAFTARREADERAQAKARQQREAQRARDLELAALGHR
jgi:HK97 family phage prohead protease